MNTIYDDMEIQFLDDQEDAISLVKLLQDNFFQAYFVGGCVRDALRKVSPHDIDICTDAFPSEIQEIMDHHHIKTLSVGAKFGTVVALYNGSSYEITTFRSDGLYSDSRRPDSVTFVGHLSEDLKRRDFTMNSLAYDPVGHQLVDTCNGLRDLNDRIIRCVGDPNERFDEDALRILRALRFAVTFGFTIEDETRKAILNKASTISNISKERITAEFEKMLVSGKPVYSVFEEFKDVVAEIIPEIKPCIGFKQNNKYHKHEVYEHLLAVTDACESQNFNVKMAALLHDIGKPQSYSEDDEGHGHFYGHPKDSRDIAEKVLKMDFRLSTKDVDEILNLVLYHDLQPVNTDKSVRKMLALLGFETAKKWFILKKADISDHTAASTFYKDLPYIHDRMIRVHENETCFKVTDLAFKGKDVMTITGLGPGKQIGIILNDLFNRVLEGEVQNNYDDLRDVVVSHYVDS